MNRTARQETGYLIRLVVVAGRVEGGALKEVSILDQAWVNAALDSLRARVQAQLLFANAYLEFVQTQNCMNQCIINKKRKPCRSSEAIHLSIKSLT